MMTSSIYLIPIRKIASITKVFVAVSIMQLVEKGKIRLDQKASEFIDEFRNPMYEKINIFNLLTHTSGIRPDPGSLLEPYPREWNWFDTKDWIKESLKGFFSSGTRQRMEVFIHRFYNSFRNCIKGIRYSF